MVKMVAKGFPADSKVNSLRRDFSADGIESSWKKLICHRPSADIEAALEQRGYKTWPIDQGFGTMNLDYYPVDIRQMPRDGVTVLTAERLLTHIRLNLSSFVDPHYCHFKLYRAVDASRWATDNAVGALIDVLFRIGPGFEFPGGVVVSAHTPGNWIFSTVKGRWLSGRHLHPVSGNRQFGFHSRPDGRVRFFTRAADRNTDDISKALKEQVFDIGDKVWQSFQQKLCAFVNQQGGMAEIVPCYAWPHHTYEPIAGETSKDIPSR